MRAYDPRDQEALERDDGVRDRQTNQLALGRGEGSTPVHDDQREREPRERDRGSIDPLDVFSRDVDLPRGADRELVRDRVRDYDLNASDTRTLSTVGAFRVVSERDLGNARDTSFDVRDRDLRNLEKQGLIQRVPLDGRERAVTLTDRGRRLLEGHRGRNAQRSQRFYSGADRPRERTHDTEVYRAYLNAADRLSGRDARILRVALDRELKRDYQRFLQERNRGDRDSDGRPDRTVEEIREWARQHDLPYFDDQVHFPDLRIEYEDAHGDVRWEDLEVTTEHYRGAHGAAASRSGFSIHTSGRSGRGAARDPRLAEEFL
jgi:DNA-binding MarR family transcriptional regulator